MQYFTLLLPFLASAFAAPSPVDVEARADVKYNCGGFKDADQFLTVRLVNELYDRPDNDLVCVNSGPGKCKAFLSNSRSTLVLCNDHSYPKCIANRELADRSSNLVGRCGSDEGVSGQIFAADRTNIIIHG
ncbi:hypothetical protein KC315_g17127 [Hortaea werneckii]|nr:hypothetical protein KC315_g17127 [Hortaea werneckii]